MSALAFTLVLLLASAATLGAQTPPETKTDNPSSPSTAKPTESSSLPEAGSASDPSQETDTSPAAQRTTLNLLGQEDTESGESRRNENVQFNLIDTNALQELNVRMGVSATIVTDFKPGRDYYGAEYGKRPSPPLHLPPGRGRGIHGSFFETHGNSVFSARSFFQVGDVQPANENRYGFRLAAPLWTGTRISLNGTQHKIRGQVNGNVLVPLPEERTPLTNDPELRRIVQGLIDSFPDEVPNRTDIDQRALNTNAPQRIDTDTAGIRLDQELGGNDRLSFNYVFTSQSVDAFQLVKGQNPDTEIKNHRGRITWTKTWSANTLTDFSAGFDRIGSLLVPEPNNFGPTVIVGGTLSRIGPSPLIPVDRAINSFRYAGQLRHTRGAHSLTAGFHLVRSQLNGIEQQAVRGTIPVNANFGRDAITNFRMGTPSIAVFTLGDFHRGFRNWASQAYVGDDWKASKNLSLTLGLRYELAGVPQEVNALDRLPYSCDCNNFAPRFGFAYRLGDRWGTLRGAYGISYGEVYHVTYSRIRMNPPRVIRAFVPRPNLADPLGGRKFEDFPPGARTTLFDFSPDLVEPYSHQYSLSWEFALSRTMNLQLGYVGSRTHKVFQAWFLNRADRPEHIEDALIRNINERRADQRFNDIVRLHNASRAYYDAGRVAFVMRNWRGVTIDTAYWWSKSIDLGTDYANTMSASDARRAVSQTEQNIHADVKSLSFFDQPHSFLMRVAYETPRVGSGKRWLRRLVGSWNLSAVSLVKTGTPFSVRTGSDGPGFGNVDGASGDRPHVVDPSVLGRTIGDPDTSRAMLPREAFAFLQPGDPRGSLGLRTFRKGKIANVNASLWRTWTVAGEKKLTFRAESVNFFNTPQFADPTFTLTSPSFGKITNTLNDGRTFRLTLQFDF